MKKFTRILICLLLCVFGVGLAACDNRSTKEKAFTYPSKNDAVTGNGGMAVQKGNFIYFANGYKGITSSEVTQNGTYTHAGLILTRLVDGELSVDENGSLIENDYIFITKKLAGFEATNLWIGGDYLYFTTQAQGNKGGEDAKNGNKVWDKEIVEFYRVKLDKTSNPERLYQTVDSYSNIEFKLYNTSEGTIILVYEKSSKKLVRIANGKSSSIAVEGVAFAPKAENCFYIVHDTDNSKYILNKFNAKTNKSTEVEARSSSFELKFVSDEFVYITSTRSIGGSSYTDLEKASVAGGSFSFVTYDVADYTLFVSSDSIVLAVKDNFIKLFTNSIYPVATITDEDADKINVVGLTNGCVVYYVEKDSNKTLKMVSYFNQLQTGSTDFVILVEATSDLQTTYFDLDEQFVYFYKTVGDHQYLFRVAFGNVEQSKEELVGVYLEADIPEVEETTEE